MTRILLDKEFKITGGGYTLYCTAPCTVFSAIMKQDLLPDPYYRDNELKYLPLADNDYTFSYQLNLTELSKHLYLEALGLDTLCDVYINGKMVGSAQNMHRTYRFYASPYLKVGSNLIEFKFFSPTKYIEKMEEQNPVCTTQPSTIIGFSHIRKNHCSFGWDWGPRLPDIGIFKNIYLIDLSTPEITEFEILQKKENGKVFVKPVVSASKDCNITITLESPKRETAQLENNKWHEIENPEFWWTHTLGEQPLYTLWAYLMENGKCADQKMKRIGLRTIELVREKDDVGESFYHKLNGVPIFAMGSNIIPFDALAINQSREEIEKILVECKKCNHNMVRLWGGGYYPTDDFFDICDELGILVFFDLMFSCTAYHLPKDFVDNITLEIEQNIKRIKHHPCLALICGNNECEVLLSDKLESAKAEYLELFYDIIPSILNRISPEIDYLPSSPIGSGNFKDCHSDRIGDAHWYGPWFGEEPFTNHRHHSFRYLSEFAFESLPNIHTVKEYAKSEDLYKDSEIVKFHQRCNLNEKEGDRLIQFFMDMYYKEPDSFEDLIYIQQCLQYDALIEGINHLRSCRPISMGTLFWQFNDVWPGTSWSVYDKSGRKKGAYYGVKKAYSPVSVIVEEDKTFSEVFVTNESGKEISGLLEIQHIDNKGNILNSIKEEVFVAPLSVHKASGIKYKEELNNKTAVKCIFHYNGQKVEAIKLLASPKDFKFAEPCFKLTRTENTVTLEVKGLAKYIEIYSDEEYVELSDNFFDLANGKIDLTVLNGANAPLKIRSLFDTQK